MEQSHADSNQVLPTVGVVGVGLLGQAMSERLLQVGYPVSGFDLAPFSAAGVDVSDSLPNLIREVSILILCLPNSAVVKEVVTEHLTVFHGNQVVIDTTTGRPEDMEWIGQQLADRKIPYLEANVAGSSEQMKGGEVALFVGGHLKDVETNALLLNALSRRWFHLGPVGSGSRFKLIHNMVLGLNRLVLAEGLEFARSLGMDGSKTLDILKQTPAYSTVMETKGRRMLEGDFHTPQARLSQHLKDVRLMLELAKDSGAQVPVTSLHRQLLEAVEQMGFGNLDNSAVIEAFKNHQPEKIN